jgi:YD repeat-containing protein
MRAARRVALVVAVLFAAIAANAQKSPNMELGFKADKQYHLTDLDAVNLFNGNLTVTIPLGLKYQVGPTLSYQFLLSYNSKAWDYHKYEDAVGTEYREGEVNLRSNAGMGWRLSFGRLISPDDYTALFPDYMGGWSYEGPAGDEHSFSGPADVGISRDTSSLRLVKVSDTQRDVEFPNGEVHEFTREHGHYRLKKMRDNLGNAVTISYVYDADRPYQWSITDTIGRQHAVYFTPFVMTDDTFDRGEHLSAISMATADVNVPAMYYFGVQTKTVTYGAQHHPRPVVLGGPEGTTVSLPFLTSITLPDSSVFALSYYDTYSDTGALKDWTVPTGGKTTYTYDTYALPGDGCFDTPVTTQSLGVVSRTTIDGTTDYVHRLGPGVILDWHGSHPCGIGPDVVGPVAPTRWSRTSVLSPLVTVDGVQSRMRTDSYFHAWMVMGGYSPADRLAADTVDADYGAPFVTGAPAKTVAMSPFTPWYDSGVDNDVDAKDDANNSAPRYLSTQVMDGCAPDLSGDCRSGTLRRSSFLRYERQPIVLTSQTPPLSIAWLKSSRAVFEDDANCGSALCYTQSLSSDWDGLSHYRMMTTTSNFPGETSTAATTWTNYRGIASPADASVLWQANLYDETVTTETNGPTYRAYACFDPSTGFLRQSRAIADRSSAAAPGSADVVKVMTADAQGNVATEKSYGGDSQTVPVPASAADDCATALVDTNGQALPPQYSIGYTYNAAGAMQTMQYYDLTGVAFPFKTVDRVIEPRTGQPMAVRDTAGVATVYAYDKKPARLMSVAPATGHATSYTYTNANGTVPAMVEFATDGAAESLGAVRGNVQFDAMGRVVREAHVTPNGMWSVVQSLYDALGRKWQVSEPQAFSTVPTAEFTPVAVTSMAFDSFGRPASTTAPDGSVATATYAGTRAIARTACVVTGVSDAGCAGNTTLSGQERVTTTETYDSRGRLVQVDEPTGGTVAKYGYDPAGRLASVYMAASGIAQSRTFAYDGRGFMTAETHPEKGSTGGGAIFYSGFDSHGHATRQRDGSATSAIDLTFVYDAADRLTSVAETGGNVVKTFSFWTANAGADKKLGKIATASRHNHIIIGGADRDVVVTDTYEYAEPGGRMTAKTTSVASGATIQTFRMEYAYNTLGDIASVVYPTCVFACSGMPSVNTVTNGYTNGGLTTVNGFATIGYDDNGRISHVQHQGANAANTAGSDEQVNTLSRISNIKYT